MKDSEIHGLTVKLDAGEVAEGLAIIEAVGAVDKGRDVLKKQPCLAMAA